MKLLTLDFLNINQTSFGFFVLNPMKGEIYDDIFIPGFSESKELEVLNVEK